ncbi:MAG: helix-turn-helix transcriptional regulator [Eubacteriales bacterium]|jgi:transcriptional regulator with XRE-family HTH domain
MSGYSAFGLEARSIMLKKSITMTSLAKELGITVSYLSEIFKGTRNGTAQKTKIAQLLGMSTTGLTTEERSVG